MVSFLFSQPNKSLPFLNKNKYTYMNKTNKKVTAAVDYNKLLPKMGMVDKAECSLADALRKLWDGTIRKRGDVSLLEFRKGFIAFAVAKKYDKRWAMEIAVKAGFRGRAAGGGRKKTKPNKNTAEAAFAVAKALPAKELKRLMKMLAAL